MPTFSQAFKFDRNSQEEIQFAIGEMEATVRSGELCCRSLCNFIRQSTVEGPIDEPKRQILNKELSGKCQAVFSFFLFLKKIKQYFFIYST